MRLVPVVSVSEREKEEVSGEEMSDKAGRYAGGAKGISTSRTLSGESVYERGESVR